MRKPAVQSWGTIVSGIVSSAGLALDLAGVFNNVPVIIKWLPLVAILFFFAFVWWHWRDQNLRIQQLENKQPTIEVKPRIEGIFAKLDLETDKTAKISVKITGWEGIELILPTPPMVFPYFAKWFNTHDTKSLELISGDCHSIDLIEYAGQVKGSLQKVLIPSDWVTREGRIQANTTIKFTVTINSDPEPKFDNKRIYILTSNKEGIWTRFEELKDGKNC